MNSSAHDRLIASIYDAAVDGQGWNEVLVTLARDLGCVETSLNIHDRASGVLAFGLNPFIQDPYLKSFLDYWQNRFTFWKRTFSVPVGQTMRSADLFDDVFWRSEFYNEWSRPQGAGRNGRYVFVASSGSTRALLRAVKSCGAEGFTPEQERAFDSVAGHFIRGLAIHRRLRLAETQHQATADGTPGGFLLVDRGRRVLAAHEPTLRRLREAGLVSHAGERARIDADDPALDRLIRGATGAKWGEAPPAGEAEYRCGDGKVLRIVVVPVGPGLVRYDPWKFIDQPAALIYVNVPGEAARERIARLATQYGLTPAEAAVAIEAAKGDGRAAVAARLGIRETTVRSHLSAIFDKLDIHRQAELARLVSGD